MRSTCETDMVKYEELVQNGDISLSDSEHPLIFWLDRSRRSSDSPQSLCNISKVAIDLCSAPASEAYCERIFSLCGDLCAGKRNRTTKSFEVKAFLKLNQNALKKLLAASKA